MFTAAHQEYLSLVYVYGYPNIVLFVCSTANVVAMWSMQSIKRMCYSVTDQKNKKKIKIVLFGNNVTAYIEQGVAMIPSSN